MKLASLCLPQPPGDSLQTGHHFGHLKTEGRPEPAEVQESAMMDVN